MTTTLTTEVSDPGTTAPAPSVSLVDTLYATAADPMPARTEPSASDSAPIPAATAPSASETTPTAPPAGEKPEPPKPSPEDELKKQLGEQRAANGRLGREVAEFKQKLRQIEEDNKLLKSKLDGTYREPEPPTPEQIAQQAEFRGREQASRVVADQRFGAETVTNRLFAEDSPYQAMLKAEPWQLQRALHSPQPVVQAMLSLAEYEFRQAYGDDPTQWAAKIEAELRPKVLEEFKTQASRPMTGQPVPTVSDGRGMTGSSRTKTIEELFYGRT
jgi:hypothetical protein